MIKQPISCSSHHRHHFHVKSSSDHRLFQTHTSPLIPWHAPPIHRSTSTSTMKTTSMTAPLHSHCRRHFVLCVLLVLCTSLSSNPSPHYLQPNVYLNQPQLHHHYSTQLLPETLSLLPPPSSSSFLLTLLHVPSPSFFEKCPRLVRTSPLSLSLPLSPSLSLFQLLNLSSSSFQPLISILSLSCKHFFSLSPSLCVAGF